MSIDDVMGLSMTAFLMMYCLVALVWPERF